MFEISQLKEMKLPELQEMAKKLNVSKYRSLKKLDLVYQILDHQAANPQAVKEVVMEAPKKEIPQQKKQRERIARPAQTTNIVESAPAPIVKETLDAKAESPRAETPKTEAPKTEVQQPKPQQAKPQQPKPQQPKPSKPVHNTDNEPKDTGNSDKEDQNNNPKSDNQNRPKRDNKHQNPNKNQSSSGSNGNKDTRNRYREPDYEFDAIIESEGVLDVIQDGYGFLRSSNYNYL